MSDNERRTESVTFSLKSETLDAAKAKAAVEGLTLDEWVERLLAKHLSAEMGLSVVSSKNEKTWMDGPIIGEIDAEGRDEFGRLLEAIRAESRGRRGHDD